MMTNDFNYKITGLSPGNYEICVDSDNYIKQCQTVSLAENIQNIDFKLYQNDRKISGTIYGLKSGQIIELWAHSDSSSFVKNQTIVGNGQNVQYEISGLPALSDYVLELISNHVPYQIYNAQKNRDNANLIDLSSDAQTGIDFNIESTDIILSGEITFPTSAPQTAWIDVSDHQFNWIKGLTFNTPAKILLAFK
ncbi:hypothetical protein MHK_001161 [Candidatus Magnetomorum sp. HK-1]|nr:hypothetical protein MHK_001161 [Candidatus Magnetomorum sp. HK-1]